MFVQPVLAYNMNVETDITEQEVIILVDDEPAGSLDRDFWNEWTGRIDNDPETCLSACLAAGEAPIDV